MYTCHNVIMNLCKVVAETYKTHYYKVTVLRKLKTTGVFLFIITSNISFENVSMQK